MNIHSLGIRPTNQKPDGGDERTWLQRPGLLQTGPLSEGQWGTPEMFQTGNERHDQISGTLGNTGLGKRLGSKERDQTDAMIKRENHKDMKLKGAEKRAKVGD